MKRIFLSKFLLLFALLAMNVNDSFAGFLTKVAESKIYCSKATKRDSNDNITARLDSDVVTIKVYSSAFFSVSSDSFDKTVVLNSPIKHAFKERTMKDDKGVARPVEGIILNDKDGNVMSFWRVKNGATKAMLQVIDAESGDSYSFNVDYGEIYDKHTNAWYHAVSAIAANHYDDDVRHWIYKNILRRFCDYEGTAADNAPRKEMKRVENR